MKLKATKEFLPEKIREYIDTKVAKYPDGRQRAAVIDALREAQHENGGYLNVEWMDAIADYLELDPVQVYEVATFYSMLETEPVGRNSISVCTNVSCMLCGSDRIVDHIEKKLGIRTGESTEDGRFYLKKEEECLAACKGAPMMMVNHKYYENLTPEAVDEILDNLE